MKLSDIFSSLGWFLANSRWWSPGLFCFSFVSYSCNPCGTSNWYRSKLQSLSLSKTKTNSQETTTKFHTQIVINPQMHHSYPTKKEKNTVVLPSWTTPPQFETNKIITQTKLTPLYTQLGSPNWVLDSPTPDCQDRNMSPNHRRPDIPQTVIAIKPVEAHVANYPSVIATIKAAPTCQS